MKKLTQEEITKLYNDKKESRVVIDGYCISSLSLEDLVLRNCFVDDCKADDCNFDSCNVNNCEVDDCNDECFIGEKK